MPAANHLVLFVHVDIGDESNSKPIRAPTLQFQFDLLEPRMMNRIVGVGRRKHGAGRSIGGALKERSARQRTDSITRSAMTALPNGGMRYKPCAHSLIRRLSFCASSTPTSRAEASS